MKTINYFGNKNCPIYLQFNPIVTVVGIACQENLDVGQLSASFTAWKQRNNWSPNQITGYTRLTANDGTQICESLSDDEEKTMIASHSTCNLCDIDESVREFMFEPLDDQTHEESSNTQICQSQGSLSNPQNGMIKPFNRNN